MGLNADFWHCLKLRVNFAESRPKLKAPAVRFQLKRVALAAKSIIATFPAHALSAARESAMGGAADLCNHASRSYFTRVLKYW